MEENTLADSIAVGGAPERGQGSHGHPGIQRRDGEMSAMRRSWRPRSVLGRTCGVCLASPPASPGAAGAEEACARRGRIEPDATVVSVVTGQRAEGRGQRHQVLRRAHLHPRRHGPAAEGPSRRTASRWNKYAQAADSPCFRAVRRLFFPLKKAYYVVPKLNIAVFSAAALFIIGPPGAAHPPTRRTALPGPAGSRCWGRRCRSHPLGDGLPAHPQGLRYELLGHLAPGPVGPEDLPPGTA